MGEKIKIDYVPVLKRSGLFTGKYVTKIIVVQGRTNIVYTIGQKMVVQGLEDDQKRNVDMRVGYIRIGVGGNSKLEDVQLLDEIYNRSKNPIDICKFH